MSKHFRVKCSKTSTVPYLHGTKKSASPSGSDQHTVPISAFSQRDELIIHKEDEGKRISTGTSLSVLGQHIVVHLLVQHPAGPGHVRVQLFVELLPGGLWLPPVVSAPAAPTPASPPVVPPTSSTTTEAPSTAPSKAVVVLGLPAAAPIAASPAAATTSVVASPTRPEIK